MMGRLDWSQRQFFYAFDLDAAVPLAVRMSSPPARIASSAPRSRSTWPTAGFAA
jgi:hypothetical protein